MSDNPRQRDGFGRFTPGHENLSPGRPKRKTEEKYLATMEQVITPEDWRLIVQQAKIDAIAGDAKARAWLSGYLMGLPISRFEQVEDEEDNMSRFIRMSVEAMREEALSLQAQGLELGEEYKHLLLVDDDE